MRFGHRRVVAGAIGDSITHGIDNWKIAVWRKEGDSADTRQTFLTGLRLPVWLMRCRAVLPITQEVRVLEFAASQGESANACDDAIPLRSATQRTLARGQHRPERQGGCCS